MRTNKITIAFFIVISFLASCSTTEKNGNDELKEIFFSNAELIDSANMRFAEISGKDISFGNLERRTDKFAFSGDYALKLTTENPYGFTTEIKNIQPDDYIKVTVWRKSASEHGVISIDGGDGFYTAGKQVTENKNGWQKIMAEFFAPPHFYENKVKVYVWNNGPDTIYFDDLRITHKTSKSYPVYDSVPGLHLHIDEREMVKFDEKRREAFRKTVLENFDEDYVRAVVFDGTDFLDAEVRLKGDLVDHLQGQKWSFRIKLRQDFAWKNLRTFSVHHPVARYFLHEWVAHEIFDQEDVLTTRYGFVPVKLNEKSLGIYAWEEHFEKHLVESRERREGPIIRFDESLFWKTVSETNVTGRNWDVDYFNAAQIIPFKEGKTTRDTLLKKQLVEAQKLMLQYKTFQRPVSEIFNLEKLAKYYALIDLTQAYHGFTWHNQRFYFNPVTCLLEPIAFDGYIGDGIFKRVDEPVLSLLDPVKIRTMKKEEIMLFQVFADSAFNSKYINFLRKFSSPEFTEDIVSSYGSATDSLENLLQKEFLYYKFNFGYLHQQARFIRTNLEQIEANIERLGDEVLNLEKEKFQKEYTSDINPNLMPYLVHAYFDKAKKQVKIVNYHNADIEILGAFIKNQFPESFEPEITLKAYNGVNAAKATVNVKDEPLKILFSVNGKLFEANIKPWKFEESLTSRQKTTASAEKNNSISVLENRVVFDGNYTFSNDVIITESKEVVFKPGTKINLVNGAGFFSWSGLTINGTKSNPVIIYSEDNTAQGFNVLQANQRSTINYAEFRGLSNLQRGGWQTPAAVNFYEADVDFENCIFASNFNCDDALNIVRSDFNVTNCRFENTFADAFDSDFCTGKVENCAFEKIGNDAIDFSGSVVEIADCKMVEISDKAISGGENSKLTVSECTIDKANIGIASKDLSVVTLNKIVMNQTVYGLIAFKKKPEFGPAVINIENLKLNDNLIFHQIEEGSVLKLNGKTIFGREKNLAKKLYQ